MLSTVSGLQRALTERAFGTQLGQTTLGFGPRNNACNGSRTVPSTCEDGGIAHLERLPLYHVLTNQCPSLNAICRQSHSQQEEFTANFLNNLLNLLLVDKMRLPCHFYLFKVIMRMISVLSTMRIVVMAVVGQVGYFVYRLCRSCSIRSRIAF